MSIAPAVLNISLESLAANYRLFKSMTGADVAGVIKANAYGTGALPVFKALRAEGCTHFFIATPDEAAQLRSADSAANLYVLGGLYKGAEDFYAAQNITPVLSSPGDVERWAATAKKSGKKLPAILHLDTGMNRLGLSEADDAMPPLEIDLRYVMSHFVASDEKDHPLNEKQAKDFARRTEKFSGVKRSLANSSGIFRNKNWHYDLLRPGYALYGGNPTPEVTNPMRPVVGLSVRILQIRSVKAGESAGYSATHIFQNDTSLAVVSMGYADGFLRSGSNRAKLFWNGQACPIVGRVSMDLIIVDIGHLQNKPQAGDLLEVLGPSQDVDALAKDLGTIGYEILTSLGPRYHRVYT